MRIEQRSYSAVPATTIDTSSEYIIPDGTTLTIFEVGGDAANDPSVNVSVVYDLSGTPEIIFSTYNSNAQTSAKQILGDGVKKITIKLVNNTLTSKTIGAYWIGETNV